MEGLQARHRKEQRELQATITGKKKAASKKTRKGVNDECARLEKELKDQQAQELAEIAGGNDGNNESNEHSQSDDGNEEEEEDEDHSKPVNGISSLSIKDTHTTEPSSTPKAKKNRQKERLARRAAEQAKLAAKAAEEAQDLPDLRARERETMLKAFKARGLHEKEIQADGHCLYSAVADQLTLCNIRLQPRILPKVVGDEPYRIVRRAAAEYITMHRDDFEPFLEEPLGEYVRKVGETGEWGGQLELQALAKSYAVDISVLDGDGSVHEIIGQEEENKEEERKVWLAYYRHGFGLGEHYNSLRKGG